MKLFCDPTFATSPGQWTTSDTGGSGSKSVSNGLVTFTGNSEQLYTSYYLRPGETLKFSIMAKCTGAVGGTVAIDVDTKGEGVDVIALQVKNSFERYEVSRTCPLSKTTGEMVMVVIGNLSATSTASTVSSYYDPEVEIIGTTVYSPPLRSLAAGLIRILGGVVSVNPSFFSHGIYSVSLTATYIKVKLNHVYVTGADTFTPNRPLIFVSPAHDNGAMIVMAGGIQLDTDNRPFFFIYLYNTTGAVINPTTANNVFVNIDVKAP